MNDLNRKNRISYYWWRRNGHKVAMVSGVILFILGSIIFPEVII